MYQLSHEQQKEVWMKIIAKNIVKKDNMDVHFVFWDTDCMDENWSKKNPNSLKIRQVRSAVL